LFRAAATGAERREPRGGHMTASAHLLTALMPGCPGLGRRGQTQHERRDADPRPITNPEKGRALLACESRRKGRPRLGREPAERASAAPVSSRADRRAPRGWQ
jgi:hypothetical protein